MAYDPRKSAGLGTDTLMDSESMPLINIIQQNSPQLNKNKLEKYIEGSSAGDMFFAPTKQILEQPVRFIPTAFRTLYVEWVPKDNGGGLVGFHPLSIVEDPSYEQGREKKYDEWLGDNELLKTTYILGLAEINGEVTKAMVALASSGQKVSRKLQSDIRTFKYPDPELAEIPPAVFARSFSLRSVYEENKDGQGYYNYSFTEPKVLDFNEDEALLEAAEGLAKDAKLSLPAPREEPRRALPEGPVVNADDEEPNF